MITVLPGNGNLATPATSPAVTTYSANFIQLVPYATTIFPAGTGTVTRRRRPKAIRDPGSSFTPPASKPRLLPLPMQGKTSMTSTTGLSGLPVALALIPRLTTFRIQVSPLTLRSGSLPTQSIPSTSRRIPLVPIFTSSLMATSGMPPKISPPSTILVGLPAAATP